MTRDEIKSARKLRKLSQAALGQLTKLSASDISRIECGYREMSAAENDAITAALSGATRSTAKPEHVSKKGVVVTPPEPSRPAVQVQPVGLAAASHAAVAANAAKPPPSGSDLNDPTNFGVMPELQSLEQGALDTPAFRTRLTMQIARANAILHTPRVPAAVWRAWRQFEQQASALLRGEAPAIAPLPIATVAAPVVVSAPAPRVIAASSVADDVDTQGEPKGFTAMFVEVAREVMPVEVSARISRAAELARQADPSVGFMKHFRRLAEKELDESALEKIGHEAGQRLASPDRSRARRGRGPSSTAAK